MSVVLTENGSDLADPDDWQHGRVDVGGPTLHFVETGATWNPDAELLVLLHGFPGFWYDWREQLDPLADAGFHVVAPDLRGYNRSDKPRGVEPYRMARLVEDVAGLVDAFGRERAHVVGHDWGGVVGWETAIRRPAIVDRLGICNAPHPTAYRRTLRRSDQLWRSWYALCFQLPWLPERVLRARDYAAIERILTAGTTTEPFSDSELCRYRNAISRRGALTAALNYYRAAGRIAARQELRSLGGRSERGTDVAAPTLVCWGEADPALGIELLDGLEEWVPDCRIERYPHAGHWVQLDASEQVNDALQTFLGGSDSAVH